jgi:hypothetical protein
MASASLAREPKTYHLLSSFTEATSGIMGYLRWFDPNSAYHGVYFNTSDSLPQWPAKTLVVIPDPSRDVVLGWRSPIDGMIKVTGSVSGPPAGMNVCGNGINWYISVNQKELAAGGFDKGGAQDFQNGLGGEYLQNISVHAGDFIYFAVDSKGDGNCDGTLVNLTISR